MTITAQQMSDAMREYGIRVREHPAGEGWIAETAKGTRLHRGGLPTPEDAVEAAVATVGDTRQREQEADGRRLFGVLAAGRIRQAWRDAPVTDPKAPAVARVWDIFLAADDEPLVVGGRSLRAAIIAAEAVLAERDATPAPQRKPR